MKTRLTFGKCCERWFKTFLRALLLICMFVIRTFEVLYRILEATAKFLWKHRKAVITVMIIALDVAMLWPAIRLIGYSLRINLNNEMKWWDFAQQLTQARATYISENIIARWLHSMGGDAKTYILRAVILVMVFASNIYWVRIVIRFFSKRKYMRRRAKRIAKTDKRG